MTAPVLVLSGWLGGLILGIASKPDRAETSRVAVAVALLFGVGALAPTGLGLYALFPDWSLMYVAHPVHAHPVATIITLLAAYVSAPLTGCVFARGLASSGLRGPRRARTAVAGSVIALALLVGLGWRRLTTVAFYEGYHYEGTGVQLALSQTALFLPLVLSAAAMAGVYVFSVLHLRRTL